jgi:hypothetical protein
MIVTSRDFARLAAGRSDVLLPPVREIGIETSPLGRYVYAPQIEISLSSLSLDALAQAAGKSRQSSSETAR